MVGILIDTCVISEIVKVKPEPSVVAMIEGLSPAHAHLSVVTIGEMVRGVALLPDGSRRASLEAWLADTEASFSDRILPIDVETARTWGTLTARLRGQGFQIAAADGLIAATALTHRLAVATRNVKDFQGTGVEIINPWPAG